MFEGIDMEIRVIHLYELFLHLPIGTFLIKVKLALVTESHRKFYVGDSESYDTLSLVHT